MQKGRIEKRHGAWHIRYRDQNGKQVSRKLADYNDTYRSKRDVQPLANEFLEPLNAGRVVNGPMTLQQFVDTVYFPYVREKKRPSTVRGYLNLYNAQIAGRIGGLRLGTFRTADGQNILDTAESETELSHRSLTHIKNLLSGIFTVAKRKGMLDGPNPMDDTAIPDGNPTKKKTHKYSLEEVEKMIAALDGVARVAVVVAAWTGLSLAELRGLKWVDVDGDVLTVRRTVWKRIVGETKTEARQADVHLLPQVRDALNEHRKTNPETTWIFEGPHAFPMDLSGLGAQGIKNALKGTGVEWHGFHALRRGLGTRLFNNGVPIETVSRILRHGSVHVTRAHYVDVLDATVVNALEGLPTKSKHK
jgi:integrase